VSSPAEPGDEVWVTREAGPIARLLQALALDGALDLVDPADLASGEAEAAAVDARRAEGRTCSACRVARASLAFIVRPGPLSPPFSPCWADLDRLCGGLMRLEFAAIAEAEAN
jgi:hypothetical protein